MADPTSLVSVLGNVLKLEVAEQLTQDQVKRLKSLKLGWIQFESSSIRVYPNDQLAAHILGVRVDCATAEDTIISKLEWSVRSGGSERQRRDIAGIVAAAAGQLDQAYIERWVAELGLEAEWAAARATEL